jgi:hypothetical protein
MQFQKAQREQARLRLSLSGVPGAGKTYSALLLAKGLGGRVAFLDTERGSGSLYAGDPDIDLEYDILQLSEPFTPKRYIEAIKAAEDAGYNVLIIDSLSHAWAGAGGVLDMQGAASQKQFTNSFTAWREVTPEHNKLVDAILGSKCHVICTMRSKSEYVMETDSRGKQVPKKIGLAPIQRDGMEYEFTLCLDLNVENNTATPSKDRTKIFKRPGELITPVVLTEEHGRILREWLESGADPNARRREDADRIIQMIEGQESTDGLMSLYQDERSAIESSPFKDEIISKFGERKTALLPKAEDE